jgi:hypothetical protein
MASKVIFYCLLDFSMCILCLLLLLRSLIDRRTPSRPSDSNFSHNWKARTWELPLLISNWSLRCINHRQSTHNLAFDKPVELHWWTSVLIILAEKNSRSDKSRYHRDWVQPELEPGITCSGAERPNHSNMDLHSAFHCQG